MLKLVETDGDGLPLVPEDIGQFFLRLDELRQSFLGHAVPVEAQAAT